MNLTRRQFGRQAVISLAGASVVSQLGCGGSSDVADILEAIITAAGAALDIGFPQYAALLDPYITAVSNFVDQASTELASADSAQQKALVIAQDAAAIVTPNLTGVAAELVTRVLAIGKVITQLVTTIQSLQAQAVVYPQGADAFFAAKKIKAPTAAQIAKIKADNAALKAKLAAAKPKASLPGIQAWLSVGGAYSAIKSPLG